MTVTEAASTQILDDHGAEIEGAAGAPTSLRRDVIVLLLVLSVAFPLLGRTGLFTRDEGAGLAQAELLTKTGSWAMDHPRPDLDPDQTAWPFVSADPGSGAPLPKTPAYPLLLAPLVLLAAEQGGVLVSVIGLVGAAVATALIARRLRPGIDRWAFWIVALGSPLFFYGWVVVGHTVGAAACGVATLLALRARDRQNAVSLAVLSLALVLAVFLRNEAVLFGAALAAAAGAIALRDRSREWAGVGLASAAGSVAGYMLQAIAVGRITNGNGAFAVADATGSSPVDTIATRANATMGSILGVGVHPTPGAAAAGVALIGAVIGVGLVIRQSQPNPRLVAGLCVLAVGAAAARAWSEPEALNGFVATAPVVVVGLLALTRSTMVDRNARFLALTCAGFVAAVLLLQYDEGGSTEWGFRYVLVAVPAAVPLAALGLADVRHRFTRQALAPLIVALGVIAGLVVVTSGRVLTTTAAGSGQVVERVEAARGGAERPVVVATTGLVAPMAWQQVVDGEDWLFIESGALSGFADRLSNSGDDVILVSFEPEADVAALPGFDVVDDQPVTEASRLRVLHLAAR